MRAKLSTGQKDLRRWARYWGELALVAIQNSETYSRPSYSGLDDLIDEATKVAVKRSRKAWRLALASQAETKA